MVFLGGAVLANIVSRLRPACSNILTMPVDGGQGEYVDIEAGMGGAGTQSTGEARSEVISSTRLDTKDLPPSCAVGSTTVAQDSHAVITIDGQQANGNLFLPFTCWVSCPST